MACAMEVSPSSTTIICMKRFAYDVIVYSTTKFGVPHTNICKWDGEENDYSDGNIITVLSRLFFKYQITQRMNWGCVFFVRYFITGFKSFQDISDALVAVIKLSKTMYATNVHYYDYALYELILSLSVVSELVIFLYTNECGLYIKELVSVWMEYFLSIKEVFEKTGGLQELYRLLNKSEYYFIDIFYSKFIAHHCLPYDNPDKTVNLFYTFLNQFRNLQAQMENIVPVEYRQEFLKEFGVRFNRRSTILLLTKEILRYGLIPNMMQLPTFLDKFQFMMVRVRIPTKILRGERWTKLVDERRRPADQLQRNVEESDDDTDVSTTSATAHNIHDAALDMAVGSERSPTFDERKTMYSLHSQIEALKRPNTIHSKAKRRRKSEDALEMELGEDTNDSTTSSSINRNIIDASLPEMAGTPTRIEKTKSGSRSRNDDLKQVNIERIHSIEKWIEESKNADTKIEQHYDSSLDSVFSMASSSTANMAEASLRETAGTPTLIAKEKTKSSPRSGIGDLKPMNIGHPIAKCSKDSENATIKIDPAFKSSLDTTVSMVRSSSTTDTNFPEIEDDCKGSLTQIDMTKIISSPRSHIKDVKQIKCHAIAKWSKDSNGVKIDPTCKSSLDANVSMGISSLTADNIPDASLPEIAIDGKGSLREDFEQVNPGSSKNEPESLASSSSESNNKQINEFSPKSVCIINDHKNVVFKRWLLFYWYNNNPLVLKLLDPIDWSEIDVEKNISELIKKTRGKNLSKARSSSDPQNKDPLAEETFLNNYEILKEDLLRDSQNKDPLVEEAFLKDCEMFMEHLLRDHLFFKLASPSRNARYNETLRMIENSSSDTDAN